MQIVRQLCIICILISNSYIPTTLADTVKTCWANTQASPYYLLAMGANTNRLKNTTNDIDLFVESMQTQYRIPKQNICKLPNIVAKDMKTALAKLKKHANKTRTIFIYFSGHGTVLSGKDSADGKDCWDEALVTRRGKVRDDNFIAWVNPIGRNAQKVYVVLDTCFSGGFMRNVCPPLTMKYIENKNCPTVQDKTLRRLHATLLAASQEQQAAWEDQRNGIFTRYLSQFLKKYPLEEAFKKAKPEIVKFTRGKGKACKQLPKRYN